MNLTLRKAAPDEIGTGFCLLEEAAAWLGEQGVDLWQEWLWPDPPEHFVSWVKQGFDDNEFYFVYDESGELVGMFRLQYYDVTFWGEHMEKTGDRSAAGYIHSFTTRRRLKGNRIGYSILEMIEQILLEQDIHLLRLDCVSHDKKLREYYEGFGFIPQEAAEAFGEKLQLYEKRI